ncbi:uncharacterized protein [Blastocystis hominis]|uniref:Uncharacterized protein n=1 Tax=Blastocystis hominis TaxID=12968 RepID=D8LZP9_BLAHO|nr:uncharacterized protein [Blastocystis hominis]CBK21288.2 unnamed protein product [Blastocystis hominis]|eukprot:XP_012895336.1 uncharacterized protein [Blastocystis hominis]
MIEFKRSGNNTIASNRIPLYVGEFVYDESKESFLRNETRIATREVEWKDGVEVSGRDLYDGWHIHSFIHSLNITCLFNTIAMLITLHFTLFVDQIESKVFIHRIHGFYPLSYYSIDCFV